MDYNKIQFEFVESESLGFNGKQIEYIEKLIMQYTEEYPLVVLKKVCDFFSWDYMQSELDEYTYAHNREHEEYSKYKLLAKYDDNCKVIGFNQIRMHNMELDNDEIVKWVNRDKKRFQAAKKNFEKTQRQARILRQPIPSFDEIFGASFDDGDLKKHEIRTEKITEEYFEVMLIRLMEEFGTIKRLVAHEFGHAIAYSYRLEEDDIIKSLYEKFKEGFENMQEFIAECFMASELTNSITLANKVKKRIKEVVELENIR